jgi:hypothetical protein
MQGLTYLSKKNVRFPLLPHASEQNARTAVSPALQLLEPRLQPRLGLLRLGPVLEPHPALVPQLVQEPHHVEAVELSVDGLIAEGHAG